MTKDLPISLKPVVLNDEELDWSIRQDVTDWVLAKSGAGFVRIEFEDINWWHNFVNNGNAKYLMNS